MGRASRRKREYREQHADLVGLSLVEQLRRQRLLSPRYDLLEGAVLGVGFGLFCCVIAALRLLVVAAGRGQASGAAQAWLAAAAFYLVAGLIGGLIFGWLRPLRDRYWGQVLTAYLILFLFYGGGTVTFLGLLEDDLALVWKLLPIWAVVCLALAPIYVRITGMSNPPTHQRT